jgi:catechol-2,3-dioxygenase
VGLSEFYREVLGFHRTDTVGGVLNFLTCNHDHHVLNIGEIPSSPHRLHHMAFQLRDFAAHGRAADVLAANDIPILWGPARHTAGHNIATYFRDPLGRLVELYAEMDVYLPDLEILEPRPWHRKLPMRPHNWGRDEVVNWKTNFEFRLSEA